MPKRRVSKIKLRVETLIAAKAGNYSVDRKTDEWVAGIGDDLAAKLASVGLIPERTKSEISTLGELVRHVESLRSDAKPRILTNLKQAGAKLTEHFGGNRPIDRITPVDVDGFVTSLLKKNHTPAYISRLVKYGKQFFHAT